MTSGRTCEDRRRHCRLPAYGLVLACLLHAVPAADAGGLIRVSDGQKVYEGQVVALTQRQCSIIDRMGQLVHLNVSALKSFEKVSARYSPEPLSTFRDALRKEFPGNYEVAGTTHYLVCAPKGAATRYSQLFESIYRDVEQFYRVRGFQIHTPDVPLVAVVFGSQQEFTRYCLRDNVAPGPGLMGYYSLKTNRVALFDDAQQHSQLKPSLRIQGTQQAIGMASVSGQTANTIIHETIHQVGYNIGIHSRTSGAPLWLVEGLATVMEPEGMRHRTGRQLQADRINPERLNWFESQHRPRREPGQLARLVASDSFFQRATLNSYSESWAFCFFLLENSSRRNDLVKYLQKVSGRDSSRTYSSKDRLAEFQSVFGDISRLEVEFIRFMDRM